MKLGTGTGITLSLGAIPGFAKDRRVEYPVILENNKPGTTDWQLTRVRPDKDEHRIPYIEGYCSRQSVKAGEKLDIMVSTSPAQSYKIDFYRTGYHSGTGGRLVHTLGPLPPQIQF